MWQAAIEISSALLNPGFAMVNIVIISIMIAGICLWLGRSLTLDSPELKITAVLVASIFVLIFTLAFLSICFSIINIGDRTQALGLPAGSMAAVIALSLVVLFAIISVFLFHRISTSNNMKTLYGLTEAQRAAFEQNGRGYVTAVNEPQAQGEPARFTVYYQNNDTSGSDFARQLLVMLGTLMTAAASFYFGSNSSVTAVKNAAETAPIISQTPASPTASPRPSPSATPTASPSASPAASASASPSASPSATPSENPSASPSLTATPSDSPSPAPS